MVNDRSMDKVGSAMSFEVNIDSHPTYMIHSDTLYLSMSKTPRSALEAQRNVVSGIVKGLTYLVSLCCLNSDSSYPHPMMHVALDLPAEYGAGSFPHDGDQIHLVASAVRLRTATSAMLFFLTPSDVCQVYPP
jgi:hypothetical protein